MAIDRRRMFAALAGAGVFGAASEARAAVREVAPRAELDAGALGLRPNAPDDQSQIF